MPWSSRWSISFGRYRGWGFVFLGIHRDFLHQRSGAGHHGDAVLRGHRLHEAAGRDDREGIRALGVDHRCRGRRDIAVVRFGMARCVVAASVFIVSTNLFFALLAVSGPEVSLLTLTISFDNFALGFGSTVMIAYMSSLVNMEFSATQYALLSSINTFFGKLLAGYSGDVQLAVGWLNFFFYAAATGLPAIVLSIFVARRLRQTGGRGMTEAAFAEVTVGRLDELDDPGCREFTIGEGDWPFKGFRRSPRRRRLCLPEFLRARRSSAQLETGRIPDRGR